MTAEPWHGTASGYNTQHCRCTDCRRAWADYRRTKPHKQPARLNVTPGEMPPSFPARACNPGNAWLFFPERTDLVAYNARVRLAKKICATCYHQADCAAWAIQRPAEKGIWGGLTERERKQIRLADTA